MKTIEVVAAVIVRDGDILCTQRGPNKLEYLSKKYEFPGGKIEPGESERAALRREISEELCIEIEVQEKFLSVRHPYPDFILLMHSYICRVNSLNTFNLTEHIAHMWLPKDQLSELEWAAADIPIVEKIQNESNEFF